MSSCWTRAAAVNVSFIFHLGWLFCFQIKCTGRSQIHNEKWFDTVLYVLGQYRYSHRYIGYSDTKKLPGRKSLSSSSDSPNSPKSLTLPYIRVSVSYFSSMLIRLESCAVFTNRWLLFGFFAGQPVRCARCLFLENPEVVPPNRLCFLWLHPLLVFSYSSTKHIVLSHKTTKRMGHFSELRTD